MPAKDALWTLLAERALRVGEPTSLSTGRVSEFYFDCKPLTLSSDGAPLVGDAFVDALNTLPEQAMAVGGLTHGADPIIGAMMIRAYDRGQILEGFYVRKEPKKHGTKKLIENRPPLGTKVVIVDDVVTSGKSLLQAVEHTRQAGCKVVGVIVLVDREEGGTENIRQAVPNYIALYTRHDFPRINQVADDCPTTKSAPRSGQAVSI